jgi:hypothetical protein
MDGLMALVNIDAEFEALITKVCPRDGDEMKCEVCGKPIEQKARGRRRTTCLGACRTAKYRSKKKPEVILEPIPGFVRIRRFDFVDEALMHAASSGYSITLPAELGTALPELGPKDTHFAGPGRSRAGTRGSRMETEQLR